MRRSSVLHALRRLRSLQEDSARLKLHDQRLAYEVAADTLQKEKNLVETEKSTEDVAAYADWLIAANLAVISARLTMGPEAALVDAAREAMAHARFARKIIEDACVAEQKKRRAVHRAREQLAIDDLVKGHNSSGLDQQSGAFKGLELVSNYNPSLRIRR